MNTKDHYQEMKARKELITDNPEASCLHCGTHEDLQVAHRVARALGGSYDRENLMVLCAPCHLRYDHQTPILRSYGRYAADSYAAYRLSSDAGTETATGAGAIG
ncbi:MAG: HNH endonuclease [Dehalococcoidia bacterium]|nr:HNH endonuclease [Dehalococcoidia bacterium]